MSYFYSHGIDPADVPIWNLNTYLEESPSETIERGITYINVSFTTGDDRLSITLDESLEIVESAVSDT